MSAVTRKGESPAGLVALGVLLLAVGGLASVWTIAGWWTGTATGFVNPVLAIRDGQPWTGAHTAAAVLVGAIVLAVIVAAIVIAARRNRDRSPHDRAAPKMGVGSAIKPLLPAALRKRHQRMGIPAEFVGVTVGHTVAGSVPVRASYEDTVTVIAGPRRNKSASIVTPNILAAPGSLLITSVKPDILGDTLSVRAAAGTVYTFDPQRLASAYRGYDCWWNPLAGVRTVEDASNLAAVFAAATFGSEGEDAFFAPTGRTLMSRYLFAAAVAGEYLPTVTAWLGRENDPAPIEVLDANGYPHVAAEIEAMQQMTERTRSGVFAYAREALSFLSSESVREWVQPNAAGHPEFDPQNLVTAPSDTLYLFSEEGPGSAGPLIAALTRAVLTAAENTARQEPSGRLKKPFMAILDEAGNICRIPDLPDKYTTYGSRGIIVITILQTQEQGEQVWGVTGFGKLWASSTVQVFGGGNASNKFLRDLSELIGDYEYAEWSESWRDGKRSRSRSRKSERIMDVSDLSSLSLGRMVVFASGCRPALVRSIPWWKDKQLAKLNETAAATAATAATNRREYVDAA